MKRLAFHPQHPERVCWGCDLYCPADSLRCGNGTERTLHPIELFGRDWSPDPDKEPKPTTGKRAG